MLHLANSFHRSRAFQNSVEFNARMGEISSLLRDRRDGRSFHLSSFRCHSSNGFPRYWPGAAPRGS